MPPTKLPPLNLRCLDGEPGLWDGEELVVIGLVGCVVVSRGVVVNFDGMVDML